tara:strand:+ start:375 stop:743 length:369 start_codon:yes stop_codon:yes gene_type:complete
LLCVAAAVAAIASATDARVTLYSRVGTPRDYTKLDIPVSSDTRVSFRIALKHRNIDVIHDALMDVSNPKSSNYGKWWTREQIKAVVDPTAEVSLFISMLSPGAIVLTYEFLLYRFSSWFRGG